MSNNLTIENLGKQIQLGNPEGMLGSGISSEQSVTREMAKNGMQAPSVGDSAGTFSDALRSSVEKVNEYQSQADTAIKEMVAGKNKNIHETMLAIERADSSLKLMMQVRNKVLDAYREIMRMQV